AADAYWVEFKISAPNVSEWFYGQLDFGAVGEFVDITDLKMGMGIVVEPDDNPQLKYYAYGLIDANPEWPDDMRVRLRIAQPRIEYHPDGPVREWWTTVGEIRAWVKAELVPAMMRAQIDGSLVAGPWCRFCPAKLACPLLVGLFRAAATAPPASIR